MVKKMSNAEIVAWHRGVAKKLKAQGEYGYAEEHTNVANYFQSHPELDDYTMGR